MKKLNLLLPNLPVLLVACSGSGPATTDTTEQAAQASTATVHLDIGSSGATPVTPNALGGMIEATENALEIDNPQVIGMAGSLGLGAIRFPGGTPSDWFDWHTGTLPYTWIPHDTNACGTQPNLSEAELSRWVVAGKGALGPAPLQTLTSALGAWVDYDYALLGTKNAHLDLRTDAKGVVQWLKNAQLDVNLYELGNEPWSGTEWPTGADFAADALPAAQGIHDGTTADGIGGVPSISWGGGTDGYNGNGGGTPSGWSESLVEAVNANRAAWPTYAVIYHLYSGDKATNFDQYRLDLVGGASAYSDGFADWMSDQFVEADGSHPDIYVTESGSINNQTNYTTGDEGSHQQCRNCSYRSTFFAGLYDVSFVAHALRSTRVKGVILESFAGEQYGAVFPDSGCQARMRSLIGANLDHMPDLVSYVESSCPGVVAHTADMCSPPVDTSTAYAWNFYYSGRAQAVRVAAPAWKLAPGEASIVRYPITTTGSPVIDGTTSEHEAVHEDAVFAQYYEHKNASGAVVRRYLLILNMGKGDGVQVDITRNGESLLGSGVSVSMHSTALTAYGPDSNWSTSAGNVPNATSRAFSSANNIPVPGTSVTLLDW